MILEFDLAVSQFIYTLRTPLLTKIMLFVTSLGSEYIFSALFLILALFVWQKRQLQILFFALLASLSLPINLFLKSIIARPRPNLSPLIYEPTTSFPSGHAMNSLVFYLTLVFLFYSLSKNKKLATSLLFLSLMLIFLIGFSRIYLGVHYPTDVLGGYLIGLCWLITAFIIHQTILH